MVKEHTLSKPSELNPLRFIKNPQSSSKRTRKRPQAIPSGRRYRPVFRAMLPDAAAAAVKLMAADSHASARAEVARRLAAKLNNKSVTTAVKSQQSKARPAIFGSNRNAFSFIAIKKPPHAINPYIL